MDMWILQHTTKAEDTQQKIEDPTQCGSAFLTNSQMGIMGSVRAPIPASAAYTVQKPPMVAWVAPPWHP